MESDHYKLHLQTEQLGREYRYYYRVSMVVLESGGNWPQGNNSDPF